jgi:hypothetical protein
MSVRITATGAVAFALLSWLTVPVSACDERYIKKCERAAASVAVVAPDDGAVAVKRKPVRRVYTVSSRHSRHMRLVKRSRAPGFTAHGPLASAESRLSNPRPESALSRRFRGFISPTPMAQNGFEPFRKPHIVPLNLEQPIVAAAAETENQVAAVPPAAPAPQESATPAPAAMTLASAESRPVSLGEPVAKPAPVVAAAEAPPPPPPVQNVAQAYVSTAPAVPKPSEPGRFPVHQLVIALCGALGAASALRFIVGV